MTSNRIIDVVESDGVDLSRRRFLSVSAAVGGGLAHRLRRPVLQSARPMQPQSAARRAIYAQRLHPHRSRRANRPDHALCRDGPGHLHVDPDADRRRAGGGPETGPAGTCSAQRKALRQSLARRAGNRQLECDTRGVAAPAPSRRDRADHARGGGGKALECRSGVLPRAKRRGASHADADEASSTASSPPMRPACRCPESVALKRPAGFQADRHAGQAAGHAREGQRNRRLWHRRRGRPA